MQVGKIAISVCTRRTLKPEWCLSFGSQLTQACLLANAENVRWTFNTMYPLDLARNEAVKEALAWGAEYLLFIDDDVLAPDDGLVKLYLDALPIVSGLYYDRFPPYSSMCIRRKDRSTPFGISGENVDWDTDFGRNYPRDRLVEVDACGAGFLLINREALIKIGYPWFHQTETYGEDLFFCAKAWQKGFKVYVDTRVKCLHQTDLLVGEESTVREHYKNWKTQNNFKNSQ